MKLNFDYKNDGTWHKYCVHCHAETVERIYKGDKTYQLCSTCGETHERTIVINPSIKWWVSDEDELMHESTGVFIRNPEHN